MPPAGTLRLIFFLGMVHGLYGACLWNLTQPSFKTYTVQPGAGWVQGDFERIAWAADQQTARLVLAFNDSNQTFAALDVVVTAHVAGRDVSIAVAKVNTNVGTVVEANLSLVPVGEHIVNTHPDLPSVSRGWCGSMLRFLRKQPSRAATEPNAKGESAVLSLFPGQPLLFYDDYFVKSREHTARRVIPPEQIRIANDSWTSKRPHPWQKVSRGLVYNQTAGDLSVFLAMNYGNATAPTSDPAAEHFECRLRVHTDKGASDNGAASEDGNGSSWSCVGVKSRAAPAAPAVPAAPAAAPASKTWPPPSLPIIPLSSTTVRHYTPNDGAVDLRHISILYVHTAFASGEVSLRPLSSYPIWQRIRNPTSDYSPHPEYPEYETLVLPVDGVLGRPLLHADSLCATAQPNGCHVTNQSTREQVCRDPSNCMCAGSNVTDIGCVNDNFGGSWLLPTVGGGGDVAAFVYAQGRRVSAFAPYSAGYDNLATVRRVLVTWSTLDGLRWQHTLWGSPEEEQVPEQYGADNFCADHLLVRNVRGGCRTAGGGYDGSPLLSFEMPFNVEGQVFWMDLRYSTDGTHFERVLQEGGSTAGTSAAAAPAAAAPAAAAAAAVAAAAAAAAAVAAAAAETEGKQTMDEQTMDGSSSVSAEGLSDAPAVAIPVGVLGRDWNGGLIMGTSPPIVAGPHTYALLEYVNNAPHFAFVFRGKSNLTTAAVQAIGEKEFFGPLLPSQWPWFKRNDGWAGVAELARNVRIEVGALRYRTEGLVCLKATAVPALVVTKLLRVAVDATGAGLGGAHDGSWVATANYKAGGGGSTSVELLDAQDTPIAGYSGVGAANISAASDGVAVPLVFGAGALLPPDAWKAVRVRLWINSPGAELYGISFRAAPATTQAIGDWS
jgi:hypothetical protein